MDVFSSCGSLWSPLNPLGNRPEIQITFPGGLWSSGLWSGGEPVCVLLLHTEEMDELAHYIDILRRSLHLWVFLSKHISQLYSLGLQYRGDVDSFSEGNNSKHAVRLCVVQLLQIFKANEKILIIIQFKINVNAKTSPCFLSTGHTHHVQLCGEKV